MLDLFANPKNFGCTYAPSATSLTEIKEEFTRLKLDTSHIASNQGKLSRFGQLMFAYFEFRANVLNDIVQHQLMNKKLPEPNLKSMTL